MRITSPPEERWSQSLAQNDRTFRLEVELEEKVLKYKPAIRDNIRLEWCWQAEPRKGGMECTILAHIWTGPALNIQNKKHLHWKDIESISDLNNEVGASVTTHNLLLKKDPPSSDHHTHKQKVASLLASPHAARKKRFIRLEWGSAEANPPAGANPFQVPRIVEGFPQHNTEPDQDHRKGLFGRQVALTFPFHV
jgi:hypothetical protein